MCSCFRPKLDIGIAGAGKSDAPPGSPSSLSISVRLRDVVVRVVHAGGRIEMYEAAVPVVRLIRRNPGMCIATPDVFRRPDEAVLSPDDVLLPGNKYFVIRCTTVEKLRRRQSQKTRAGDELEDSVTSKDDFAVARDGWSKLKKHMKEKKKFVPPIQRPRIWKESDWEPSLNSIKELSL
ncbi:hypothetical protein SASPL_130869 [Salvia splendens]|uniref:Uncharacterized protein n=1 Tax=Salvia splendens TaxID=180675 RepID=A0A8X8X823_SALSN|nr:hypothetical protein SASPL_130869 [Salvia splendens]